MNTVMSVSHSLFELKLKTLWCLDRLTWTVAAVMPVSAGTCTIIIQSSTVLAHDLAIYQTKYQLNQKVENPILYHRKCGYLALDNILVFLLLHRQCFAIFS